MGESILVFYLGLGTLKGSFLIVLTYHTLVHNTEQTQRAQTGSFLDEADVEKALQRTAHTLQAPRG